MTADAYAPDALPDATRNTITVLHLSALLGVFTGIGFLLGPLAVWFVKRDEHPAVDEAGKEAVNFQIHMLVLGLVAALACMTGIGVVVGVPLAIFVGIAAFACPIVAAVRSINGEPFRYPFSHEYIK
ncbi:MAG: DUF4870 domain-containing protein [Rubricoccaceae bacterium]|nr:DUF4870 domain-containing protein [Rubricoccaceae bacterium]